ncbi:MAG: hypothetical protein ABSE63_00875 [Thermoguttaceae bacterium]|jgi:hypothetical protein
MSVNLVKQWFPQLLTALDRAPMAGLICAAAILFGVTLAWTRSAAMPNTAKTTMLETSLLSQAYDSGEKLQGNDKKVGLREGGEIVDQAGCFRATGNRLTFVSADNKHSFIALENHNLEQVARAIAENAKQLEWIVSGTISEYRGENFLLVNRAELKSRIRPSAAPQ